MARKMSKKDRTRLNLLIDELVKMSRAGWRGYTSADWLPLEAEMRTIYAKYRMMGL